jgi:guanylate kinase
MLPHKNFVILISSPSGAGKSTLVQMLLQEDDTIQPSVSATTREKRKGEVDGVHYYFLKKKEYEEKIKNNEFFEHAKVYDNYYGTLKQPVENMLNQGYDTVFTIDWQGGREASKQLDKTKLLKIFILPPSIEELEKRLRNRGQDSEEIIQKRMEKAKSEISHYNEYDYVVINDDLNKALAEIRAIIDAKRIENAKELNKFIEKMIK